MEPSQKARVLAEGISGAMNCTALALAVWIPSVIAALVLSRTSRRPSA
ncbi:MAG: MotA/TolQ/ExbB proton channel family protein [Polyangiaceae bacterium]